MNLKLSPASVVMPQSGGGGWEDKAFDEENMSGVMLLTESGR